MKVGDSVVVVKGVLKNRIGIIKEILFGEYHVRFNSKEIYWLDDDELKGVKY
jgi:hypothetical protein